MVRRMGNFQTWNESSRRNLGQPGGTSPAVPPVCPIVSLAASRAKQNRGGTGSLHLAQPEGTSPAVGVARGRHPMTTEGLLQAHGVLCYVIFENKEHIEVK